LIKLNDAQKRLQQMMILIQTTTNKHSNSL